MPPVLRSSRAALCIILALYLTLTLVYNVSVPLWEAPEEALHFDYVRYLVERRTLPPPLEPGVQPPPGGSTESMQPPLYYLVGAIAVAWVEMGTAPTWHRNPYVTWQGHPGARAIALHREDESFPYRGTVLAAHLLRLLSSLMGMVAVLCTFLVAREIFREKRLAITAAALTAFTPGFLFTTSTVNNDNAAIMMSSLLVWTLVRVMKSSTRWGVFGLALILALLTAVSKNNGLYAVPLVLVATSAGALRKLHISGKQTLSLVAAAVALTLGVRLVFPDTFQSIVARSQFASPEYLPVAISKATTERVLTFFPGFFATYWGDFGWQNVPFDLWQYLVVGGFCAAASLGLIRWLAAPDGWRALSTSSRLGLAVLATGIILLFYVIFVRHLIRTGAYGFFQHARYFFPVIAGTSLFLVVGLRHAAPAKWRMSASLPIFGYLSFLLALAVAGAIHYIPSAYPPPVPIRTTIGSADIAVPYVIHYGDVDFLGSSPGMNYDQPGEVIAVTLFWKALNDDVSNFEASVALVDRQGRVAVEDRRMPLQELPPEQWLAGEIAVDRRSFAVPADIPPGVYSLEIGIFTAVGHPEDGSTPRFRFALGDVRFGQQPRDVQIPRPLAVDFEDGVSLVGYDLAAPVWSARQPLTVTLFWKARRKPAKEYVVFVHAVARDGSRITGHDSQPADGGFPTVDWRVGDTLRDEHHLLLPEFAPSGVYAIEVGLYDVETTRRLLTALGADRAGAGEVRVRSAQRLEDVPNRLDAIFGDKLLLLGQSSLLDSLQPGDSLPLRLYWQAIGAIEPDYKVFVHLVNSQGAVIAQEDSEPAHGNFPTSRWETGEVVVDDHNVAIPGGTPPGQYRVVAGIYLASTMRRLPITKATTAGATDSIALGAVTVH